MDLSLSSVRIYISANTIYSSGDGVFPVMHNKFMVRSYLNSPVMARLGRTGLSMASDNSAVTMVQPAEGPSLGVAPSGTCRCTQFSTRN